MRSSSSKFEVNYTWMLSTTPCTPGVVSSMGKEDSRLILLNALYGADAPHPFMGHGSDMEDPAHPGHLNSGSTTPRAGTRTSQFRPSIWLEPQQVTLAKDVCIVRIKRAANRTSEF